MTAIFCRVGRHKILKSADFLLLQQSLPILTDKENYKSRYSQNNREYDNPDYVFLKFHSTSLPLKRQSLYM